MSSTNLPEWIVLPGGHNLHHSTAVQAAHNLLMAHRLLFGAEAAHAAGWAHARLLELLGDPRGEQLDALAQALINAATEVA